MFPMESQYKDPPKSDFLKSHWKQAVSSGSALDLAARIESSRLGYLLAQTFHLALRRRLFAPTYR